MKSIRTLELYLMGLEDVLKGELSAYYRKGENSNYDLGAKAKMEEEIGHIQTALKLIDQIKEG